MYVETKNERNVHNNRFKHQLINHFIFKYILNEIFQLFPNNI